MIPTGSRHYYAAAAKRTCALSLCVTTLVTIGACTNEQQRTGADTVSGGAAQTCLPDGSGYLRAHFSGAIDRQLDWPDSALECEGGPRPTGNGVRLSLRGPAEAGRPRLRLIIGLAAEPKRELSSPVPANITVMLEDTGVLYSMRGDTRCLVEELRQSPLSGGDYRVSGRGFCTDPATTLDGSARLHVLRFDFAARANLNLEEEADERI